MNNLVMGRPAESVQLCEANYRLHNNNNAPRCLVASPEERSNVDSIPSSSANIIYSSTTMRKNSRSACTTSSTVLTCTSSPSSYDSLQSTSSSSILDYSSTQYEDEDEPYVCWSVFFLLDLLTRLGKKNATHNAFSDLLNEDHASKSQNTSEDDSSVTPMNLNRRLDNCCDEDDQQTPLLPNHRPHNSELLSNLQQLLQRSSQYESECNLNASITNLEQFIHQSQYLSNISDPFMCTRSSVLHKLGSLQWKCGRYELSLYALIESMHLYERILYDNNDYDSTKFQMVLESAHVLISTGRVYLSMGRGTSAMHCYHECVHRLSSIPSSFSVNSEESVLSSTRIFAQACVGAGRVLSSQGKLRGSLKRFKRALKVQLGYQGRDTPVSRDEISELEYSRVKVPLSDVAETLLHLGRLYEQRNNALDRALVCHTQSFRIYSRVLGINHVDAGHASNNLGRVLQCLGRIAEAELALQRGYQILSNSLGQAHRSSCTALLSIGQLYASQGRHKKALEAFQRVLSAQRNVFGGDSHVDTASTLHCIASSYQSTFKLEKAMTYYRKEVNVLKTTLHPYHLDVAKTLYHMATVAMGAVNSNGEYLIPDESIECWLVESMEVFQHHNIGGIFQSELFHLEASIQATQARMRRKMHSCE